MSYSRPFEPYNFLANLNLLDGLLNVGTSGFLKLFCDCTSGFQ